MLGFAKMILCDRCSASYCLASLLRGRRALARIRQMDSKNWKMHWHEAVSSAFSLPFLKTISQNCFVFDVVNFES